MRTVWALGLGVSLLLAGCSVWNPLSVRSQGSDAEEAPIPAMRLVGDLAVPYGLHPIVVESVGFVSGLRGTGSDPQPSPERDVIMREMQQRGIEKPNALLASSDTALVLVRAVLRPGIQKGDSFDVEVRVPSNSETTSLRGGTLWTTELNQLAVMPDSRIHRGHALAAAKGPVMVDPGAETSGDRVLQCRGRILGGGNSHQSRPLLLVLKPEHQSVRNSARIQEVVNRRFHTFDHGNKVGVATAKTDEMIELKIHSRYHDNIERYIRVVRSIPLRESESERARRLVLLEKQLLDPITSSRAALQLEAIGSQGVEVLKRGLASSDPEVRFYSAETLAYLDETGVAEILAEAAEREPAFRVFALAALSAMEDYDSKEQLQQLLNVPSAETRYGAFRSLTARRSPDPLVRGELLGGQFSFHVLPTSGSPMIHIARTRRPEIVLFGDDQRFQGSLSVEAGNRIMINSLPSGEIAVARYVVGEPDQRRLTSPRVDEVIRAIVELGGTYPDVVQALQEAKAAGGLASRLEVDALPTAGRIYERLVKSNSGNDEAPGRATSPIPDLFSSSLGGEEGSSAERAEESAGAVEGAVSADSAKKPKRSWSLFDRIRGRDRS